MDKFVYLNASPTHTEIDICWPQLQVVHTINAMRFHRSMNRTMNVMGSPSRKFSVLSGICMDKLDMTFSWRIGTTGADPGY